MNNDLISREDLLNAIHKVIEEAFGSDDIYDQGYNNGLFKASELIDNAPTVYDEEAFSEGYERGIIAHETALGVIKVILEHGKEIYRGDNK